MKRAKTTGQLKSQCAAILAAAINGKLDLKIARVAVSAAHAAVRLHESETAYISSMLRQGQKVDPVNEGKIHDEDDDPDVIAIPE